MTDARQMNGQCRAPASCSENGNLTNGKLLLNGPVHHALPDAALGAKSGLLSAVVYLRSLPVLRSVAQRIPGHWQRRVKNWLRA